MNLPLFRGSSLISPLFVLGALLLLSGEAHVGQFGYEEIGLEHLVRSAKVIVVAKKVGEPEVRTVVTEGKASDGETRQVEFSSEVREYRVLEVLKGRQLLTEREQTVVTVGSATLHSEYELTLRYYLEGLSESPIFSRYAGSQTDEDARVILYLDDRVQSGANASSNDVTARSPLGRVFEGVRLLTVTGAVDSTAELKKVKALLKKKPVLRAPDAPRN